MNEKIDIAIETVKGVLHSTRVQDDILKASQAVLNLTQAKVLYVSFNKPTEELDKEIHFVLGRVRSNVAAPELMKVTQAVVNLMHAKAQVEPAQPVKTPKTT